MPLQNGNDSHGEMPSTRKWTWVALLPVISVIILWLTDSVRPSFFLMDVPTVKHLSFLETKWAYAYLHFFTFIPVLALSFDRNVHYYKRWKALLPSALIIGLFFILWDVFFTRKGVWGFNEKYLLDISLLRLPLEEWLFFFTVPFACVFIYECLNFYVIRDWLAPFERGITIALIVFFLSVGIVYWKHLYTATTFLLSGGFVLFHLLFLSGRYRSRFYLAFLISLVPFFLVNGVLTGGYTKEPIVFYNPEEYLGVRITSVPLDDAVYGFLLLMGNVTLYEIFKSRDVLPKKYKNLELF